LLGVGTFAVISLMVGTAVNDANCDGSASSFDSDLLNTTTTTVNSLYATDVTGGSVVTTTETSSGRGISPEMQCRVGVAMAVTFLAGIFQVTLLL